MLAKLKDNATANMMRAWSRLREISTPVTVMLLMSPILAYFSGSLFFKVHAGTGKVLHFNPWVPAGIWVAVLLLAALKPLNIAVISLLGARQPSREEEAYLAPLWQEVTRQAGVRIGRYVLRVTEHRSVPVDRDLGPFVVTIDDVEALLPPEEVSAVLAQRISRQRTTLGSALAICLWALLPLVLCLLLAIAVLAVLRAIYRAIFKTVDDAAPHVKTEGCAGAALVMLAAGIAVFIAFLVVGTFTLQFLIEAAIGAVIVSSLARSADRRADSRAIQLGYGPALAAALDREAHAHVEASGWRKLVNTSRTPAERIAHIESCISEGRRSRRTWP